MKSKAWLLFIFCFLFSTCKKEKPVIFSGQLLLTEKYPFPISNRKIEIYQKGSPGAIGINSGALSSSATTVTDANGNFRVSFIPGTSSFIVFTGVNHNPLTLSNSIGDTSFPRFYRRNFPDSGYDPARPIFIGKSIDTGVIKVNLMTDLNPTDTIGLRAYTITGSLYKEYTGRTASAGSIFILDTIINMLFTDFDCVEKKFMNTLYAGRQWTTVWGYKTISGSGWVSPYQLSEEDETKKEITFYFSK